MYSDYMQTKPQQFPEGPRHIMYTHNTHKFHIFPGVRVQALVSESMTVKDYYTSYSKYFNQILNITYTLTQSCL